MRQLNLQWPGWHYFAALGALPLGLQIPFSRRCSVVHRRPAFWTPLPPLRRLLHRPVAIPRHRLFCWRFPNFRRYCRPFPTTRVEFQKLRWLGFPLPLHCFALFNHDQETPFIVFIAAFGRFMRRSRIPKRLTLHTYSRCGTRSCGAGMRPRTPARASASRTACRPGDMKASGWPRAKPEPRSGRKGTRESPNARRQAFRKCV